MTTGESTLADLHSGERQVAHCVKDIRADHRYRYEWAAKRVAGLTVLDAACGCGYGSAILADHGCTVYAVDRSQEAVDFGKENWHRDSITWICSDLKDFSLDGLADVAVCFETLEHLDNAPWVLAQFRRMARQLIVSVPNESKIPLTPGRFKFHKRHYTQKDLTEALKSTHWLPVGWWGQLDAWAPVEALSANGAVQGQLNPRTLVAVCR